MLSEHVYVRGQLRWFRGCVAASGAAPVWPAAPPSAQTAENVAVVINEASAESRQIGEYYVKARDIPAANVIG